jgi:hypothetical protein
LKRESIPALDFALLPSVQGMSLLSGLNSKIDREMQGRGIFPETLNRARGAVMLFHKVHGPEEPWKNESYIRGGLCEFYSMDETLARDLRSAAKEVHQIRDSRNPLLHLMALMRNINVHAATLATSAHDSQILFGPEEPRRLTTINVAIITDLTFEKLLRKREIRNAYSSQDLNMVVGWFNDKQRVFGVSHLLAEGVEAYCQELLAHYPYEAQVSQGTDAPWLGG